MQIEPIFRALGDATRLRIVRLLGSMELAVGEIAQVLGQSQPRVSRHIGILCDVALAERRREGSWVFLRAGTALAGKAASAEALSALLARAEQDDPGFGELCAQDRRRLAEIRASREVQAAAYFAAHAHDWDEVRRLHTSDDLVEAALAQALLDTPLGRLLDIGTGTGRMAELFAERAEHIVALDKSLAMLRVARAKLQHLDAERVELVQGDFESLPFAPASFDTVLFHQVLHFAQAPVRALAEAARVTRGGGRIAIVDFAAHQREELRDRHAHARLGFSDAQLAELFDRTGFDCRKPIALDDGELVVKIWVGRRREAEGRIAS
ncbi:MAG: ArsR/SmtB family transcription factor [Qipengyuania sp.]